MKRFLQSVGMLLLCGALALPAAADSRGQNTNTRRTLPSRTTQPANRPGNMGQGNSSNNNKQPAIVNRPSTPTRPTMPGQTNNQQQKPAQPGSQQKPGNQQQHPGHTGNQQKPGNNQQKPGNHQFGRPQQSGRPRPQRPPQATRPPQAHPGGPVRPPMPAHPSWSRPTPPASWRPPSAWRPFRSILGVTFGTSINLTLSALINSGYSASAYGNNQVYVSNVPMLNMTWPEAILYYNNLGGLCGSRFMYSTSFYDMSRYNMAYTSLVAGYGTPVSVSNTSAGVEASWWGTDNQFITLSYNAEYATNGTINYYTTLSFGN